MNRKKFIELTKNPEGITGFSVVRGFEDVPELIPRTLWDLCDVGVRFGVHGLDFFSKEFMLFSAGDLQIEVYNFTDNGFGGSAGFMVGKYRPSGLTDEGTYILKLLNGMNVIWDRGFSVADVSKILYQIEKESYRRSDVVGGRRRILYF